MAQPIVVVNLDEYVRRKRGVPGRPRKYAEGTVSVSFRVPESVRNEGREKALAHGVNMTELLAYHYKQFVTRPIEETRKMLREEAQTPPGGLRAGRKTE